MTDNLELWNRLGKTDPSQTKAFTRGGGFKGTAIKPMWSYKRMTEEFGPIGKGWGVNQPTFQVVPGNDGEVLVYCTVSIWYEAPTNVSWGIGGDKVVTKFSSGMKSDDEAFKKAFTDAITNALKMIGVGADVHMGMFDDNKYVNTVKDEFQQKEQAQDNAEKASKNEASRAAYTGLQKSMRENKTTSDLKAWWQDHDCIGKRNQLPGDWQTLLHNEFVQLGTSLKANEEKVAA